MYDVNVLKNNGINVTKCLEFFGNIEMYDETLKDFLGSVAPKITAMGNNLSAGKLNDYLIDLHSLKSDARYLGFEDLSKVVTDIENACMKSDIDYVKANHTNMLMELKKSINVAKLYFRIASPKDVESSLTVASGNTGSVDVTGSQEVKVTSVAPTEQTETNTTIKINLGGGEGIRPIIRPKLMKDKIMIVDDSSLIVKFVIRFLSDDYEIISASDGSEAIEKLDDENFRNDIKLVLLDLNMPKVDGYQVLEYCLQHDYYKDVPIAVESGIEDAASLDRVNSYPIVGILLKPFKESDLRRVVEKSMATYF